MNTTTKHQSHRYTDGLPGSTRTRPSFGDEAASLCWIDLKIGHEEVILRIHTQQLCEETVMRVDPHSTWDRTWRYVMFNTFVSGTRRVFVADMKAQIS